MATSVRGVHGQCGSELRRARDRALVGGGRLARQLDAATVRSARSSRLHGNALATCRDWTAATFASERAHGLLAPWVLHTGLGPDNAVSGFMTQVIACAVQLGGMPVPVGGGAKLVDALCGIVTDAGGAVRTDAHVDRIVVSGGKAIGIRLSDGETVGAQRAVVAGVTPTQLYGALLAPADAPAEARDAAAAIPVRAGGDAAPPRDERAAGVARPRRRAPCARRRSSTSPLVSTASPGR